MPTYVYNDQQLEGFSGYPEFDGYIFVYSPGDAYYLTDFSIQDLGTGTATLGDDFVYGTANDPSTARVWLELINDGVGEAPETLTLELQYTIRHPDYPDYAEQDNIILNFTILDNDGGPPEPPQTAADQVTVINEGSHYVFNIGYSHGENVQWTYTVSSDPGTASSDRYFVPTLSGGQASGIISVNVSAIDNNIVEPDQDFFVSIFGSYTDLPDHYYALQYSYSFQFVIVDNDKVDCVFDIDGNGVADSVELSFSEAWHRIDVLETKQQLYQDYLVDLNNRVTDLQAEAAAIDSEAKLTLTLYLSQVASLGAINSALEILPAISSIVANAYNVLFQGTSSSDAFKDSWTDLLDVFNNIARNPIKFLPLVSLINNTKSALDEAEKFYNDLALVKNNIESVKQTIGETENNIKAVREASEALKHCLSEQAGSSSLSGPPASNASVNSQDQYVPSSALAAFAISDNNAIEVRQAEVITGPNNLIIVSGSDQNDSIQLGSNFGAGSVAFIETGNGDDTIQATEGSLYVSNSSGNDSIYFFDPGGGLASIVGVSISEVLGSEVPSAIFGVSDKLFVAAQNVERFVFQEGEYRLEVGNPVSSLTFTPTEPPGASFPFTTADELTEALYVGYFGRAGDPGGTHYWTDNINAGYTIQQAAASFSVQVETKELYPFLADPLSASGPEIDSFISSAYADLFNRAPDPGGLDYWYDFLTANLGDPQSVGVFIMAVINGAQNTAAWGLDQDTIANKVYVAKLTTQAFDTAGINFGLAPTPANQFAHTIIGEVDSSSESVDAAKAAIMDFTDTYSEVEVVLVGATSDTEPVLL